LLGDEAPPGPFGLAAPQGVFDGEQLAVCDGQPVRLANHAGAA